MDKTITRTKAIRDISDKCDIMSACRECKLNGYCSIKSFEYETNSELESIYNLMFDETVRITDTIESANGNNFTVRLDNINTKCFEKLMSGIKKGQLDKVSYEADMNKTNPNYYKNECSLECIEAMLIAFGSDKVYDFCICNAFKYMWRYQNKNGVEDIKKARWYVDKAKELIPEYLEWQNIDEVLTKIESEVIA
jgi:hypothetical protein